MTDELRDDNLEVGAPALDEPPQYGVGPFSIREVALVGTWVVAFVISFFPVFGQIGEGPSVWSNGIDWVLTIGVPTIAVFLIVLRRLSPQGIRRVGSLGIDQFASVAFSVSTVLWLTTIWNSFITLANQRFFAATWVVWVEFFLMLAGVLLTVFAPLIAPFAQDFRGRPEVPAHRSARPVRAIAPRPAPAPRPTSEPEGAYGAADAPYAAYAAPVAPDYSAPAAPDADGTPVGEGSDAEADHTAVIDIEDLEGTESAGTESVTAESDTGSVPQYQAFWALVPEERDVVDEIGIPVFRIGPTAWALVIEDRGEAFVVRHEDGRIGYLHDVSGVTRG